MQIGKILCYDKDTGKTIIGVRIDADKMAKHNYTEVEVFPVDPRCITKAQRDSIHAIIADIAGGNYRKYANETLKDDLKKEFISVYEDGRYTNIFSLSNVSITVAAEFMDWLLVFCIENNIPNKIDFWKICSDTQRMVYACIINKKCVVCGKDAILHHHTAVGMGRNRDTISHKGMKVLSLCTDHHTIVHAKGDDLFLKDYKFYPIKVDDKILKVYEGVIQ